MFRNTGNLSCNGLNSSFVRCLDWTRLETLQLYLCQMSHVGGKPATVSKVHRHQRHLPPFEQKIWIQGCFCFSDDNQQTSRQNQLWARSDFFVSSLIMFGLATQEVRLWKAGQVLRSSELSLKATTKFRRVVNWKIYTRGRKIAAVHYQQLRRGRLYKGNIDWIGAY